MENNLLITSLNTSTGQYIYYTDLTILYWFLGIEIIFLIIIALKKKK